MAVPKSLEGLERFSREILGSEVIIVVRITGSIPSPTVILQSAPPVAVVANVNGASSFVVRLARPGSVLNTALPICGPTIKEILLSGASIGRAQRYQAAHAFGSTEESSCSATLQVRLARRGAENRIGVDARVEAHKVGDHVFELDRELGSQSRANRSGTCESSD